MVGKVEGIPVKRDELAKVVADLEARLMESESRLEESKLRAVKVREASKKLEEELIIYKNKVVEQHEKCFQKAVSQVGFFTKDLDLVLLNLSRM